MRSIPVALFVLFSVCALAQAPAQEPAAPAESAPAVAQPAAEAIAPEPPVEGCRPLTDKAMAADLKALTAQSQKQDASALVQLNMASSALWAKAVEQCDGRAKERAQRNLAESKKATALLNEQLTNAPECATAHKDATTLQDMARTTLGERRWIDAAVLFHKAEDMWDLAVERCTGTQKDLASKRLEQAEIDGFNAEFCAPLFDKAREFTQKLRASAAGISREEKNDGLMVAETLWREAKEQCKGTAAQESARNNAQALARERGTPWVPRTAPVETASAPPPKPGTALAIPAPAAAPVPTPAPAPVPVKPSAAAVAATANTSKAKAVASLEWDEPTAVPATASAATAAVATAAVATSAASTVASTNSAAGPLVQATLSTQKPAPVQPPQQTQAPGQTQPESFVVGDMRFKGQFVRDADTPTFSGTGQLTWANGDMFEGSLQGGKRHGKGLFVWANGQRYKGDWVNDTPTGQAVVDFANANHYEGPVINGIPEGVGRMVYASGDTYAGKFKAGEPEGRGAYVWKNGQKFEGDWKSGKPNGQGVLQFASGDRYEGTVLDGVPDQSGTFTWTNGDRYTGQWKAGSKNGQGTLTWTNGDRWEGVYENDGQTTNGNLIRKAP